MDTKHGSIPTSPSLSARLDSLEATLAEVVETRRVVVKDADGKTRATIGPQGKLPCVVSLYGDHGESLVSLSLLASGAALEFEDPDGGRVGILPAGEEEPGPRVIVVNGDRRACLSPEGVSL